MILLVVVAIAPEEPRLAFTIGPPPFTLKSYCFVIGFPAERPPDGTLNPSELSSARAELIQDVVAHGVIVLVVM
jgi:hypothetical protein